MSYSHLTFLVVDDFSTMRRIVKNILRKLGVTKIHEAENGEAALRVLKQHHIDFILTDWNMPVMSGLDFLINVRKNDSIKHLPVIMVTAEAKREQIVLAAQHGVNSYIIKPFSERDLSTKIEQVFSRLS